MATVGKFTLGMVPARAARPAPNIGAVFGSLGLNMAEFCKTFNERTSAVRLNVPMRVKLTAASDRTYRYSIHYPNTTWFMRRAARIVKGKTSKRCKRGQRPIGFITNNEVYCLAQMLAARPEHAEIPLPSLCRTLIATARSAGIRVTAHLTPAVQSKRNSYEPQQLDAVRKERRQRNKLRRRR